jgi:lipoprotein NlpI
VIRPRTDVSPRKLRCGFCVPHSLPFVTILCCLTVLPHLIGQSGGQKIPAYFALAYTNTVQDNRNNNNIDHAGDGNASAVNEERCADPSVDANLRIVACSALIQSDRSSTDDLATAYMDRGNAYQDRGEYDRAIQDYGEAIHLKPQFELAIYDRANAYGSKGEYDHAIADYDQVIELAPGGDHAYFAYYGRGYAFNAEGEYDRAIKDYDQAIRLNPDSASTFIVRGVANFLRANPALAVTDLRRSSELNPKITYSLLWLHLARTRLGESDSKELIKRSAKADLVGWPGPVLKFYLGRMTVDQMMAAAVNPDVDIEQRHLCDANFFAGEDALLHSHYFAARSQLEKAVNGCPLKNLHRDAAAAELKRLNATAESAKPNSLHGWRLVPK